MHAKVIIIGSGPAGYTAAIYAARAMLEPVMIQGLQPGGQLTITTDVENYPGFADVIQGPWLMDQMKAQAEHVGTRIVNDIIVSVDFDRRPFTLTSDSGTVYTADSVIIATGAQAKWLGLPSEQKFQGFGVSACATCDGFFFRNKPIAVIGGGDSAVEEATFLSRFGTSVTMVHRRDELRASKIMAARAEADPKVDFAWNSVVESINGENTVESITLRDTVTGQTRDLEVQGVFVAIGHDPRSELVKGQVDLDAEGYVLVQPGSTATSVAGVFAAGDLVDHTYRQAITAAGTGCSAALDAERYLASLADAVLTDKAFARAE